MAHALAEHSNIVTKALDVDYQDVDMEGRVIKGWCSTPYIDRDGEVVLPSAFEKHLDIYMRNPILLQFHQHRTLPIGKCIKIEVRPEGLWGEFYIANTQTGNEILELIKTKCLRGFSAGFVPIDKVTNPDNNAVPAEFLKGMNKKGFRSYYREVELVEISLLSIPSNRQSLIQFSEKGNKAAGLIIKAFDAEQEDITPIINEWLIDHGRGSVLKGLLEGAMEGGMVLKQLLNSSSYHHALSKPLISYNNLTQSRDPFGKYVPKNEISTPPTSTDQKLDTMIQQQRQMVESLDSIDSKDSWAAWAKKWGVRLVGAAAAYGLWKAGGKELLKDAARNHLSKWIKGKKKAIFDFMKEGSEYIRRGYESDEETKAMMLTDSMDILDMFLQKGRKLGVQKTPEYKEIESKYKEIGSNIVNLVRDSQESGLKALLSNIKTKEMTGDEFKEEEHPRQSDGKFRKKNSAKEASKTKSKKTTIKKPLSKKEEGMSTNTKVAIAAGATAAGVILLHKGIQFKKTAAIVQRFDNREAVRKSADEIINAMETEGKTFKQQPIMEDIVNIEIIDDLKKKTFMNKAERDWVDYIAKTDEFQKDLARNFGHLEDVRVPTKIRMVNGIRFDFERPDKFMMMNQPCFSPGDNELVLNPTMLSYMNTIKRDPVFKQLLTDPKKVVMHEYTHAVSFNNKSIVDKYLPAFTEKAKGLEGKPLEFKIDRLTSVLTGIPERFKGKILEVEVLPSRIGDHIPYDYPGYERIKNTKMYNLMYKVKDQNNKIHSFTSEQISIFSAGDPTFKNFKLGDIKDPREVYGLNNIHEYLAVMVEKGGKL